MEPKYGWPNQSKIQASVGGVPFCVFERRTLVPAASCAGTASSSRNATNNPRRATETRHASGYRPRGLLANTSAKFSPGSERDLALPHATCQGAALAADSWSRWGHGDLDRR